MRQLFLVLGFSISVAWLSSCHDSKDVHSAATVEIPSKSDTSLVLKPTAEQLAKAIPARNVHCPTDGEKIGSMGPGVPVVYKGRSVFLCCPNCPKEFAADPDKYLAVALADTVPEK
jgi:YHS domain-containing protein